MKILPKLVMIGGSGSFSQFPIQKSHYFQVFQSTLVTLARLKVSYTDDNTDCPFCLSSMRL